MYRETKVDLAEEEFILLAATAAGHGEFVSFDALANTVLGEAQTDDPVKCVLAWVNTIHSRLRSLGVLEDIVEIDMHAGLRLAESFGP